MSILDPFDDIDPLATMSTISEAVEEIDLGNWEMYITETNSHAEDIDDEIWVNDDDNNFKMMKMSNFD